MKYSLFCLLILVIPVLFAPVSGGVPEAAGEEDPPPPILDQDLDEGGEQPVTDYAMPAGTISFEKSKSFLLRTDYPITRASVADEKIADVRLITQTQLLLVSTQNTGSTNLIVWHGDNHAEVYRVSVSVPAALVDVVDAQIKRHVPNARIGVTQSEKGLMLSGEAQGAADLRRILDLAGSYAGAENVSNMIEVLGDQQVQLEVKVAEVSRSGVKQLGLGFLNNSDWNVGLFPSGSIDAASSGSNEFSSVPTTIETEHYDPVTNVYDKYSGPGDSNFDSSTIAQSLVSSAAMSSPYGSAFQILVHSVNNDSVGIISLLKGQGVARILAKPTLVAMSGQPAEFLVGGEFPVPTTSSDGQTNIDYRNFGVMLKFTPVVLGQETISIQVEPEVSEPDYTYLVYSGGVAVPGLKTRRASTTLRLKDGQTFVMAGLLEEKTSTVISKVPFLGEIPILGTLFTSKEYQNMETELVILVTPRLARPLNPEEIGPLPGDELDDDVDDFEFFILNKLFKESPPPHSSKDSWEPDYPVPEDWQKDSRPGGLDGDPKAILRRGKEPRMMGRVGYSD